MINPCPSCSKHESNYDKTYGVLPCDECLRRQRGYNDSAKAGYPEFVPDRIKEERLKYAKDTIQPYRQGELSREFVEAFPNKVKGLDPQVVKKSKYVWGDIPAYKRMQRS